ncbi:MAG: SBBP repeat-containing protein [Bacteroidia bacterium]|nr:SBBP repeat-containing protein [Bacteroidia bacterium]
MKKLLAYLLPLLLSHLDYAQTVNWEWAVHGGGYSYDSGNSVTCDDEGYIILCGDYNETAYFGNYSINSMSIYGGAYITKIDSFGNFLWVKKIAGTDVSGSSSLTTDSEENIYIAGFFADTVFADNDSLVSNGSSDFFTGKYDKNGNLQWTKSGGGIELDANIDIACYNNNIYICGEFRDTVFNDSLTMICKGGSDILIYSMDLNGNYNWFRQAGGSGWDVTRGIAVSNDGFIYITGIIGIDPAFGDTVLNISGNLDAYIAKYDTVGNFLWVRTMGGNLNDHGISVTCDYENNVYVTGLLYSTQATFGDITVNCYGNTDYYLAKLNPAGEFYGLKLSG